jgi:hypothetical protein
MLCRIVSLHTIDLGGSLAGQVNPSALTNLYFNGVTIPLQDSTTHRLRKDKGHIIEEIINIEDTINSQRASRIEVDQLGAPTAALKAHPQLPHFARGPRTHLRQ